MAAEHHRLKQLNMLVLHCPSCKDGTNHESKKVLIVRHSAEDFAACPRCGLMIHPASCECDKCVARNARKSTPKAPRVSHETAEVHASQAA